MSVYVVFQFEKDLQLFLYCHWVFHVRQHTVEDLELFREAVSCTSSELSLPTADIRIMGEFKLCPLATGVLCKMVFLQRINYVFICHLDNSWIFVQIWQLSSWNPGALGSDCGQRAQEWMVRGHRQGRLVEILASRDTTYSWKPCCILGWWHWLVFVGRGLKHSHWETSAHGLGWWNVFGLAFFADHDWLCHNIPFNLLFFDLPTPLCFVQPVPAYWCSSGRYIAAYKKYFGSAELALLSKPSGVFWCLCVIICCPYAHGHVSKRHALLLDISRMSRNSIPRSNGSRGAGGSLGEAVPWTAPILQMAVKPSQLACMQQARNEENSVAGLRCFALTGMLN